MNDLETLVSAAQTEFDASHQSAELENAKARYIGKSGRITELLKGLGALPPDEKKSRGAVNVHESNMGHMAQMLPFAGL